MGLLTNIADMIKEHQAKKEAKRLENERLKKEILEENRDELKQALKEKVIKEEIGRLSGETTLSRGMKNIANEFTGYAKGIDMNKWKERNLGDGGSPISPRTRTTTGGLAYPNVEKMMGRRTPAPQETEIYTGPDIDKFLKSKRRF